MGGLLSSSRSLPPDISSSSLTFKSSFAWLVAASYPPRLAACVGRARASVWLPHPRPPDCMCACSLVFFSPFCLQAWRSRKLPSLGDQAHTRQARDRPATNQPPCGSGSKSSSMAPPSSSYGLILACFLYVRPELCLWLACLGRLCPRSDSDALVATSTWSIMWGQQYYHCPCWGVPLMSIHSLSQSKSSIINGS